MYKKEQILKIAGRLIILICFPVISFLRPFSTCANENYPLGSRAAAMGNAVVAVADLWSVHHNQAGLASINRFQAGIHHENRFMVPEFALQAVVMAIPVRPGTIALSYTYFGFSKYNETKLGLAFGRSFGERISAGVRVNYLHTFISDDYGNSGNITAEGGFIAQPVNGLFIAAHIYNPTRTGARTYYDEPLPTILRFGLAGRLGGKFLAAFEVEKGNDHKAVFKSGLEMSVQGPLYLRTGIMTNPVQASFGIGYAFGNLIADLAFTNHQALGLTPHLTLAYLFR